MTWLVVILVILVLTSRFLQWHYFYGPEQEAGKVVVAQEDSTPQITGITPGGVSWVGPEWPLRATLADETPTPGVSRW